MPLDYAQYQAEVTEDIAEVLSNANCQPILFVGSGFTRRYAKGPNWEELLRRLAQQCPTITKDFAYYKQVHGGDLRKIGSQFTECYREWAWGEGRQNFPAECFSDNFDSDVFIKVAIARLVETLGPDQNGSYGSPELDAEIAALKAMSPHAVVTTNYDLVLEKLFPDYQPIVGQQIMRLGYLAIGEIFKIHGCCSSPLSIIINEADYQRFDTDHKYLSAKLLTYFIEHPLLFIGYRAEDPNIKAVLYDVQRMVQSKFELIPNIYILDWDPDVTEKSYPARDKVISVGDDTNIRVKNVTAASFDWVFSAFGRQGTLEKVNTKLLRSLMARAVHLIRTDIPKKHVEIDFETLDHAVDSGEDFAKLFGVTSIADPAQVNLNYKFTLSQVAEALGYDHWYHADQLIKSIKTKTGVDIKASDNAFHIALRIGQAKGSMSRKYSEACIDLLRKEKDGVAVEGDLQAIAGAE